MWLLRRRAPLAIAGVLVFIAGALPTLGFVDTLFQDKSTVADHYLYLSMVGVAMIALDIVSRSKPARMVAVILLIACGVQSFRQTAHWRDSYSLFSHTVAVSPRSWAARMGLGSVLISQKNYPEAERYFREAVEIYPWSTTHLALGQVLLMENRPADAIAPLEKTIGLEPGIAGGRLTLASAYLGAGRSDDAKRQLQQLLREHPDDQRAADMLRAAQRR
jgi:tetratricopeptide (TPR) repeat protein